MSAYIFNTVKQTHRTHHIYNYLKTVRYFINDSYVIAENSYSYPQWYLELVTHPYNVTERFGPKKLIEGLWFMFGTTRVKTAYDVPSHCLNTIFYSNYPTEYEMFKNSYNKSTLLKNLNDLTNCFSNCGHLYLWGINGPQTEWNIPVLLRTELDKL